MSVAAKGAGTVTPARARAVDEIADDANVVTRIAAVMADCRRLEKTDVNAQQGYAFTSEADMTEMLRPLLAAAGLVLRAELESVDRWVAKFRSSEGTGVTVHVRYTLHGPLDSLPSQPWQGDATDNADKALPKALTAAKKSFLVHTFLLSTGVDPDAGGELSTRPAPAPRPAAQPPPAPDRPASDAQRNRAYAMAAEVGLQRELVTVLAHLLTRTRDDPAGKGISALSMAEIRKVFDAIERYPSDRPYWDERLGKMAAFLDREALGSSPLPTGGIDLGRLELDLRARAGSGSPDDDIPF